jgi:hypothetical protein
MMLSQKLSIWGKINLDPYSNLPNYGLILPNYADKSDKMMNEY